MAERPELTRELDEQIFREFYYLKDELIIFCRQEGLQATGGKIELTNRIAQYLETGEKSRVSREPVRGTQPLKIEEETLIESNFVCSEKHREFFKEKIGKSFSFNVLFQKWLKANEGKTYRQAIEAYYRIKEEKKDTRLKIDKQFEYNTYIQDFFACNKGRTLSDGIRCWKYKKAMKGHNKYEEADLAALSLPLKEAKIK